MAGGSRSDLASSSPEGSTFTTSYPNGQRGSYSGPSMERSGSFRESLENRVSSSGAGVARSPTPATSAEIPPLSSSLMLEPLSLSDQKYPRYGELRMVLGVSLEEHPFGAIQSKPLPTVEELKHFKVTVQEASTKARDRAKMLHESIAKVDRFRSVTRKRSRNEIATFEKSAGVLKTGSQIHQNSSDPVAQRLEERTKNTVPNKRIRSSMVDTRSEGRGSVLLRQVTVIDKDKGIMDREKNMLRACNGGVNLAEEKTRGLPTGGDGWDKNMKRKRSAGALATRAMDPERELKQGMQPRFKNEPRPRLSDGVGFRPGSSTAINKLDGSSQQNFGCSRNLPKSDLDGLALSNDRREHSSSFEKERNIAKGTTKLTIREDSLVGSQSPLTKGKASRAPRTGSASISNSSSAVRTPGGIDGWEQSPSLNKNQPPSVTNNRKRPLSAGPPSPHVAQWVGQRPQRIRMRRTNLISPVSGHDESQSMISGSPASDAGARLSSIDTSGSLIPKGTPGVAQQLSMKLDDIPSPAVLSESEESGAAENNCKEKVINNGEDGALNVVKKLSTVVLPTKKNKPPKEELVDGRKLGRNGRSLTQSKPGFSLTKEKLENIQTTKLMRNGRPSSDRSESKVGRPPSKKVTDRKTFTRPGHVSYCGTTELVAEYEDDHEELFAAANYVQNSSNQTSSTLFWKTVSPYFSFVGSDSIALLKQQMTFAEELDRSLCIDVNEKDEFVNPVASQEKKENQANIDGLGNPSGTMCSIDERCRVDGGKFETDGWLERVVPLSQRLLAAIIPEYEMDCNNDQQHSFSHFATSNFCDTSRHADLLAKDSENKVLLNPELEMTFQPQKNYSRDNSSCNGYASSNNFRSPVINNHSYSNGLLHAKNTLPCSETSTHPEYIHNSVGRIQDVGTDYDDLSPCVFQYEQMSLDEKILLELQSIGLEPEAVPDLSDGEDEQIDKDICKLKMKLYQKARSKKTEVVKLYEAVQNARTLEEKKIERLALDKLVEIAYRKFLGGRGNHGSSSKGGVSKVSKQVALAFAKRTLARCRKFECTEQSCFSELPFRNILLSVPPLSDSAKPDAIHSGAAAYAEPHSSQPESHLLDLSSNMEGHGTNSRRLDRSSGDFLQAIIPMPDQSFVKHETVSSRGKKREALLDDVVGNAPSRPTTTLGSSIPGGAKGKRSERERDHNKDASTRSAKVGRPSIGSSRSERKTKTKLKQKTAQLSTTGILVGRNAETDATLPLAQESCEARNRGNNKGNEGENSQNPGIINQDLSKELEECIDFSSLPLAIGSIEELGVGDELSGQVEDFWLNVEEDMQDNDIMGGLEIPMDDLTDLNMNF